MLTWKSFLKHFQKSRVSFYNPYYVLPPSIRELDKSVLYKEFQEANSSSTPFERLNGLKFDADLIKRMGPILF